MSNHKWEAPLSYFGAFLFETYHIIKRPSENQIDEFAQICLPHHYKDLNTYSVSLEFQTRTNAEGVIWYLTSLFSTDIPCETDITKHF